MTTVFLGRCAADAAASPRGEDNVNSPGDDATKKYKDNDENNKSKDDGNGEIMLKRDAMLQRLRQRDQRRKDNINRRRAARLERGDVTDAQRSDAFWIKFNDLEKGINVILEDGKTKTQEKDAEGVKTCLAMALKSKDEMVVALATASSYLPKVSETEGKV